MMDAPYNIDEDEEGYKNWLKENVMDESKMCQQKYDEIVGREKMERDELQIEIHEIVIKYRNYDSLFIVNKILALLDGWKSPEEIDKQWSRVLMNRAYMQGYEYDGEKEGQP
jgi:hypothetical protein